MMAMRPASDNGYEPDRGRFRMTPGRRGAVRKLRPNAEVDQVADNNADNQPRQIDSDIHQSPVHVPLRSRM